MAQYGNSMQKTTPVVLNLIIINAIVFVAQMVLDKTMPFTGMIALYAYNSPLFQKEASCAI